MIEVGDCREVMATLESGSVGAIVTDPPYGLEFMGKDWDKIDGWRDGGGMSKPGIGERFVEWVSYGGETANPTCAACGGRLRGSRRCSCEVPEWRVKGAPWVAASRNAARMRAVQQWHEAWLLEAERVLKPGGYLLAFGGTRTFHRLTSAAEDAGFEVKDCLCWLYGSGFPKSHNLDGQWAGWGTALKPAWEPIIVARKPLVGTVARNVAEHGTGALNIDGCRIATGDSLVRPAIVREDNEVFGKGLGAGAQTEPPGRWPANVALDDEAAAMLDEQTGAEVSRFMYVAKASRAERNAGLEGMPERTTDDGRQTPIDNPFLRGKTGRRNTHPTVKPIALMRWLVRLVAVPGAVVLDPFAGSGSTLIACTLEGVPFVGIERDPEYVEIATRRIAYWRAA